MFVFIFYFDAYFAIITKSGVARNIDEYVPAITPTASTSAKFCVASPPKKNNHNVVIGLDCVI